MNLISAIVHVHYGDCYENESTSTRNYSSGRCSMKTEYAGEGESAFAWKVLFEDITSINRSGHHSMEKFYMRSLRTTNTTCLL